MDKRVQAIRLFLLLPASAMLWVAGCLDLSVIVLGIGFGLMQKCACWCGKSCAFCEGGRSPNQMQLHVSGVVDDFCTDCENLNADWVLDFVSSPSTPPDPAFLVLAGCTFSDPITLCATAYRIGIIISDTDTIYLYVGKNIGGSDSISLLSITAVSHLPDCFNFESFSLDDPVSGCDTSSATFELTSVV